MSNVQMARSALSVLALISLAACGGATTSLTNQELLDASISRGEDLEDRFSAIRTPSTANLPGSANYTGSLIAAGGVGNPSQDTDELRVAYIGDLDLDVSFTAGNLSGTADNFIEVPDVDGAVPVAGEAATGSLSFVGTRNNVANIVEFGITVDGRIDGEGGSFLEFDQVAGDAAVFGAGADAIAVNTEILVEVDGEPGFIGVNGIAGR